MSFIHGRGYRKKKILIPKEHDCIIQWTLISGARQLGGCPPMNDLFAREGTLQRTFQVFFLAKLARLYSSDAMFIGITRVSWGFPNEICLLGLRETPNLANLLASKLEARNS